MPAPNRLLVHPNPFAALDVDGNPAGAFQEEGAPGVYIGATLVTDGPEPPPGDVLSGAATPPTRRFLFEAGEVSVPATSHYLYALRTGELLPADERTAREAGIAKFVPHEEALKAARKRAIADFKAAHGYEPACVPPTSVSIAPPPDHAPTADAKAASGDH